VARKEHGEFSSNIDMIDVLPPGLYEAVFEQKTASTPGAQFVSTDWVMRCEARTLDDLRALGGNDPADDRSFAAVAKVSEINNALYRTFLQPMVRAMVPAGSDEWMRKLHPVRLPFELFCDANPFMAPVKAMAEWIREHRSPTEKDNPFIAAEHSASEQIATSLDAWREMRDGFVERLFLTMYGAPALQAAVGVDPTSTTPPRHAGKSVLHRQMLEARTAELKSKIATGGLAEAGIRAMLYAGMPRGAVDERAFAALRAIRPLQEIGKPLTLSQFKAMVREQFYMLLLDAEAAVAAIPKMLPTDIELRRKALAAIRQVLSARGNIEPEIGDRLRRLARLFGVDASAPEVTVVPSPKKTEPASRKTEPAKAT